MNKQKGFTLSEMFLVLLIVFGGIGWIWNVVKLAGMCCEISGMIVLRGIGVFVVPLGAIMGWL